MEEAGVEVSGLALAVLVGGDPAKASLHLRGDLGFELNLNPEIGLGRFMVMTAHMNQAIFAFRRYENASLSYTGIESHTGLRRYGLYDTVVAIDQ